MAYEMSITLKGPRAEIITQFGRAYLDEFSVATRINKEHEDQTDMQEKFIKVVDDFLNESFRIKKFKFETGDNSESVTLTMSEEESLPEYNDHFP